MNLSFVCFLLMYFAFSVMYGNGDSALTCFGDEAKCADDECCIQIGNTLAGTCLKRLDEGKLCERKPLKNLIRKHVYKNMCPCKEGLVCMAKEGKVGKLAGKCQNEDSDDQD